MRADQRSARRRLVRMRDVEAAMRSHETHVADVAVREVRTARSRALRTGFAAGALLGVAVGIAIPVAAAHAAPAPNHPALEESR